MCRAGKNSTQNDLLHFKSITVSFIVICTHIPRHKCVHAAIVHDSATTLRISMNVEI